ncbi:MAG: hypothetical protein Q8P15_02940 [Nanoarchaeota archaeon]|nr:hypothetical protein [Nanoarchaeota archaeon]
MAKEGGYKIENFYQGGYSTFKPNNIPGITTGSLGLTTDPRNANVLQEVSSKLSSGVKQIELEMVSPDSFDQVPKQQFEELRRLQKLTGVDVSVHGPVIDTTGVSQQGYSELNREYSEKKILEALKRSFELNPDGNVSVNFHTSEGIPGSEWKTLGGEGKERTAKKLIVVNRESGKLAPLEGETMFYPGHDLEKGEFKTPEWRVDNLNGSEWDNSISQLIFNKEKADEILQKSEPVLRKVMDNEGKLKYSMEEIQKSPVTMQALNHYQNAAEYIKDTEQHINSLFNRAFTYGTDEQKQVLKKLSENFKTEIEKNEYDLSLRSNALQKLLLTMKNHQLAPDVYVPFDEFAVEQSSKTFGNAAFESWKQFKNNSPIVNIENPPATHALSTGEDVANVVRESRKHFVERAVKEGVSKSEAEKQAEKLIGATWDVGHINMLRRQGFNEKDIIKETEKVAPFVKHIHLSDNFGMEHTELPMGMGNVPLKEMMEKLGKQGVDSRKIIEAAHWWQHFKSSPVQVSLEGLGSPVYSGGGPYWSQNIGLQQGYLGGYGMMLPQGNYQMFGAGWAQLPVELGGQMPGAQGSRMSGHSME